MEPPGPRERPLLAVFAPSPIVTVVLEASPSGDDEIHLHAGGQGFWVSRMAALLGGSVTICAPLGGESGEVLRGLIGAPGVNLRAVGTAATNGCYVEDRRSGERQRLAAVSSSTLQRHEIDDLYGAMMTTAMTSDAAVLTGPEHEGVVSGDVYRRLAADLRSNGIPVVADLSGTALDGVLAGGVDILKLSDEELTAIASAPLDSPRRFAEEIALLKRRGARAVLISRAEKPAFADVDGELLELTGPRFEPLDHRGAGDSMVAALAVAVGRGLGLPDALRLAVAAGALNVTRRGLGSGRREDIERLAGAIGVHAITVASGDPA